TRALLLEAGLALSFGNMTVDSLLRSRSFAFSTRLRIRVPGDCGVVLLEGECELAAESDSVAPFGPLRSELGVVFGLSISERISVTDLCLIAPDCTRVVIRSSVAGAAAGVEGVLRGVDAAGVTEDFFESDPDAATGSLASGTTEEVAAPVST